VESAAYDVAVSVCDYCAHMRIRRRQADPLTCEFERTMQMLFVSGLLGHGRKNCSAGCLAGVSSGARIVYRRGG